MTGFPELLMRLFRARIEPSFRDPHGNEEKIIFNKVPMPEVLPPRNYSTLESHSYTAEIEENTSWSSEERLIRPEEIAIDASETSSHEVGSMVEVHRIEAELEMDRMRINNEIQIENLRMTSQLAMMQVQLDSLKNESKTVIDGKVQEKPKIRKIRL